VLGSGFTGDFESPTVGKSRRGFEPATDRSMRCGSISRLPIRPLRGRHYLREHRAAKGRLAVCWRIPVFTGVYPAPQAGMTAGEYWTQRQRGRHDGIARQLAGDVVRPGADIDAQGGERVVVKDRVALA
jgi:hypothetical protein